MDIDIEQGLPGLENPLVHRHDGLRQRRKDLLDGSADVLGDRFAVDLGQQLVDPEVAEVPVQQTKPYRGRLIEMVELQGLVADDFFLGFGRAQCL